MPFSLAIICRASKNSKLFLLMLSRSWGFGSCAGCLLLRCLLGALLVAAQLGCGAPFEQGAGPLDLGVEESPAGNGDAFVVGTLEAAGHPPVALDVRLGLH